MEFIKAAFSRILMMFATRWRITSGLYGFVMKSAAPAESAFTSSCSLSILVATITENQIDLDTLQLSIGTHTIKVTAGGTNFESSPFSNEVTYEVAATTIDGQYKWNSVLTSTTTVQPVNFVSNEKTYGSIRVANNILYYDETVVYNNGWVDDKYRLVNFGDAPQTITSIFDKYVVTNAYKLTKLDTPNNIEVNGSNVSFEADERATQFEFVVNGTSWGDYSPQTQQ